MLVGMNELSPVDIFISEIQELLKIGQVKILAHYAENQTYQGIPVIGYYKDNRKFICLLPRIATDLARQQLHNLFEILGNTLLPIISPVIKGFSGIILGVQKLAKTFPGFTKVVLGAMVAVGGLLLVGGMLLASLGALGMAIPAANTALAALGFTATITGASISAAFAAAFWPVTIGIAAIYALKKAWDSNLGGVHNKVASL